MKEPVFGLNEPLFEPGNIRASQSVIDLDVGLDEYVVRHVTGDWGKVPPSVRAANDRAVEDQQGTIGSAYKTPSGRWLFVITRSDRSVTTVLVPEDLAEIV